MKHNTLTQLGHVTRMDDNEFVKRMYGGTIAYIVGAWNLLPIFYNLTKKNCFDNRSFSVQMDLQLRITDVLSDISTRLKCNDIDSVNTS